METTVKKPSETTVKITIKKPSKITVKKPLKTPSETPSETPSKTPSETPSKTPSDTTIDTTVDTPVETPLKTPSLKLKPYLSPTKITIIHNDCIEEIKKMENNSIDCVITDPPYFIDKLDNNWSAKDVKDDKKNSHIKHLPKGMKFDKKQVKDLYDFYLELSTLLFEKLKPGGYFLSFSSPRLYHPIAMACEISGFEIRDMINWTYTQSMAKGMSVSHIINKMKITPEEKEVLIEQYKDFKTPQIRSCFEPICVAMKPIGKLTFIKNELQFNTGLLDFSQKVGIEGNRTPANIITTEEYNETYDKNFMVSKPSKKEKGEFNTHITVKPVNLMEHLIKLFSKEGGVILDPFLGSGTTAVACKNTNRNCIGIERNPEYIDICKKRCG
jgi:site-specific DNA-methyltransferase (adenine-specific)